MRATSSGPVMAALLFGLVAILVPIAVTDAALVARSANTNNTHVEGYVPFLAEHFDLFDWSICKKLAKKYSGNMVISPISLKLALVLLYEGAEGETKHELAGALHFPDADSVVRDRFADVLRSLQEVREEYALDISTRLIVDSSIRPEQPYRSIIKQFYSTDVVVANLSDANVALRDINDWVSNVTHGHVQKLLTDADKLKDSVFLVLNALYFRGTWKQPFEPSYTRTGIFHTDLEKTVAVPYMHRVGNYHYVDAPQLDARIIKLPYLGNKYSMFIVLPGARTGLSHLVDNINLYILRNYIRQMEEVPVDLSIPKFKFDFTAHLENVLRELGIRDIFDNTASLIGIHRAKHSGQRLAVSDFVQKAGLEVDEFGTTAYAVTEVQIGNKIADTAFHVTHPFLFFIEDESTHAVLFVGKVTDPTKTSGKLEEPVLETPTRLNPGAISDVPAPAPAPGKTK